MINQPEENVSGERDTLAGSQTRLLNPQQDGGGSNSRALKIAGVTTLICALIASQIFTAVIVLDQSKQIEELNKKSDRMGREITRSPKAVSPSRMQMPMRSLPMAMDLPIDSETKNLEIDPKEELMPPTPEPLKLQKPVSMEDKVKGLIQDFELPSFNKTFMDNLEGLKKDFGEEEWKSFESWLRYWLIFKMAQDKSDSMTKCQEEAEHRVGKVGTFKPQCDEHGSYKPRQCWHATGFCWCVDKDGKPVEGTASRSWPKCA